MKEKARKSLFDHMGLKILSIILAVFFWVLIMNLDDFSTTKTIRDIPVTELNGDAIEDLGKVYSVTSGKTVDIIVKGPRSIVDQLTVSDFEAEADLSELSITNSVQINVSLKDSKNSGSIEINYVNNTMNLTIEDIITKELPVKAVITGEPAEGFALGQYKVTPNIVTLSGPQSQIERITEVRAPMDISGIYTTFAKTIPLVAMDAYGESMTDKSIEMSSESVEAAVEICPAKMIPIKITTTGAPARGYSISSISFNPQVVAVAGPEGKIDSLHAVYVNVSVDEASENVEKNVNIAEFLQEGYYLAEQDQEVAVNILIEKEQTSDLTIKKDDVALIGVSEDLKYELQIPASFKIRLTGLQKDIQNVTTESLQLKLDVTDLEVGEHEPKLTYAVPKNATVTVIGTIKLEVKEKEEQATAEGQPPGSTEQGQTEEGATQSTTEATEAGH